MRLRKNFHRLSIAGVGLFACWLLYAGDSLAASFTWDGGGANNNWSAGGNWSPDGAPASDGTAALLFVGAIRPNLVNDFPSLTPFTDLSFGTPATAFTLSGASVALSGNIDDSTAATTQAIDLDLTLSGAAHTINVANTGTLSIRGAISGVGASVVKTGFCTLVLSGTNSYTGATTVNSGTLQLDATHSLDKLKLDGSTATLSLNTATSSAKLFEVASAGGNLNHGSNTFTVVGGPGVGITLNTGAQLHVQGSSGGKLVLDTTSNVLVADSSSKIIVESGATLEVTGNFLTAGGGRVNVETDNGALFHVNGTKQLLDNITGTGNTTVDANKSASMRRIVQNSLTIGGDANNSAATVTIITNGDTAAGLDSKVSVLNSLSLANDGAAIDPPPPGGYTAAERQYFGRLDLTNNDLIITNGSPALFTEIQDMVRAGVDADHGITSRYAMFFPGPTRGTTYLSSVYNGYDDDLDPMTPDAPLLSSFDGISLTGGEIIVKYTWFGDADLDGLVTGVDFGLLLAGLDGSDPNPNRNPWVFGDFDYNGIVDAVDYGQLLAGISGGGATVELPEPASLLLAALGAVALTLARVRSGARRAA